MEITSCPGDLKHKTKTNLLTLVVLLSPPWRQGEHKGLRNTESKLKKTKMLKYGGFPEVELREFQNHKEKAESWLEPAGPLRSNKPSNSQGPGGLRAVFVSTGAGEGGTGGCG